MKRYTEKNNGGYMVRSDKAVAEPASAETEENGEIERIIQEIEDLEKSMDSTEEKAATENALDAAPQEESLATVTPIRRTEESLVESDATPALNAPLIKEEASTNTDGSLDLRIGGCGDVSLDFSRAGITVTVSCRENELTITTDQGAEFRIPFKKMA